MASATQRSYIKDLAVLKLKEFKEFKEMIASEHIMGADTIGFTDAKSVDEILDRITDKQASKVIDALLAKQVPVRSKVYAQKRSEQVIDLLDKIKANIGEWKP